MTEHRPFGLSPADHPTLSPDLAARREAFFVEECRRRGWLNDNGEPDFPNLREQVFEISEMPEYPT